LESDKVYQAGFPDIYVAAPSTLAFSKGVNLIGQADFWWIEGLFDWQQADPAHPIVIVRKYIPPV
jgi:hypothetical protein